MENFEGILTDIIEMIKKGEISALRECLTEINVVDTEITCFGEGFLAIKAKEFDQLAPGSGIGTIIANITLFAVLIYELIGPMLTKISLQKAGEISPEGRTSARTLIHLPHLRKHEHHGK